MENFDMYRIFLPPMFQSENTLFVYQTDNQYLDIPYL